MTDFSRLSLDQLANPIWVYDPYCHCILWANHSALGLWEAGSLAELQSRDFKAGASEAVDATLLGYLHDLKQNKDVSVCWQIEPKGHAKKVFCRFSAFEHEGHTVMLVEGQDSGLCLLEENSFGATMVVLLEANGNIVSNNPLFSEQFGFGLANIAEILHNPSIEERLLSDHLSLLQANDLLLTSKRGPRWHTMEIKSVSDQPGANFVLTLVDVHARKLNELKLRERALIDPLTNLLNRNGLLEVLEEFIVAGDEFYLLYVDLDGFKAINDTYGHAVGDRLLIHAAGHLRRFDSSSTVAARLGGDEFVLLVKACGLPIQQAQDSANALIRLLSEPQQVRGGFKVTVSASIGLAVYPEHEQEAELLLSKADAAMYLAKENGRRHCQVYQSGMEVQLLRRSVILQSLDRAIRQDEFELHYQTIIAANSNRVEIVEALLRWQHPQLGYVAPNEVIEVAEGAGKIAELETWVFNRAARDFAGLQRVYGEALKLSLNISVAHLLHGDLVALLRRAMQAENVPMMQVIVELTEGVMLPVVDDQQHCLEALLATGCQLAIDDFGTGYSSLAYISRIPATYVKIDKAFVDRIDEDIATLKCILQLAKQLDMLVIVEGVETQQQYQALQHLGLDLQQGYYFQRPCSLGEQLSQRQQLQN